MDKIIVIEGDPTLLLALDGDPDVTINGSTETHETYFGPYEVIPLAFTDQILETNNKIMTDDVTVFKVPYHETSNLFDGKTAYIAEVVNDGN